jgi:hypothetical protein
MSSGPEAELSFDGLNRVNNARFAGVWIRNDVDFSVYRKLLVLPAEIAYKKASASERDESFLLDERQMEKLRELFRDSFRAEIVEKGGWEVVEQPGPDVLLAQAGLIDLVVRVPTRRGASARGGTWVSSYGAMTLVVQLYDSQTRRILARVVDRLEVAPSAGAEFSKVDMSASIELRIFFQKWAERLREGLDAVRARQP